MIGYEIPHIPQQKMKPSQINIAGDNGGTEMYLHCEVYTKTLYVCVIYTYK